MSVAGSVVRGIADEHSDLDVCVFFADAESRERAWAERWSWDIAPWFHRFDADHVRPHFVIYLFEPAVKADIALYGRGDLPPPEGGPYRVAWDDEAVLAEWATRPAERVADWSPAVHEDERFWAWTDY